MQTLKAAILMIALTLGVTAQATDFSARVEASALLDEMNLRAQLDQVVTVMLENQIKQNPNLAPYKGVMAEFFKKYMSYDSLKPDIMGIYEANFTAAELHDMRMFYATPTGKKMVNLLGEITRQSVALSAKRVQEHTGELEQMINAEAERIKQAQTPAAAAPAVAQPVTPPEQH
jgi:hypothetical protein